MNVLINKLKSKFGNYSGEGINHEGQSFLGKLQVSDLLNGKGVKINFLATGKDGTIYHMEESFLAPDLNGKWTLWNCNNNSPGVIPHELIKIETQNDEFTDFIFAYGSRENLSQFREEISLKVYDSDQIAYTYSWGLPDGDFCERSGVRMSKNF